MSLLDQIKSIASDLSDPNLFDRLGEEYQTEEYDILNYLDGMLDIEYIVSDDAEYRGARILVSFGGPNIWINTRTNMVEGHWWEESASVSYDDAIGLDDTLREFWDYR